MRVYVLRGIALKPSNSKGTANPYVVCQLGNKTMGESKDVIKGTLYPPFYKMFEFRQPFPGCVRRARFCGGARSRPAPPVRPSRGGRS